MQVQLCFLGKEGEESLLPFCQVRCKSAFFGIIRTRSTSGFDVLLCFLRFALDVRFLHLSPLWGAWATHPLPEGTPIHQHPAKHPYMVVLGVGNRGSASVNMPDVGGTVIPTTILTALVLRSCCRCCAGIPYSSDLGSDMWARKLDTRRTKSGYP